MGFSSRFENLIRNILCRILISEIILIVLLLSCVRSCASTAIAADNKPFYLNRYFLQIDNIFDYKGMEISDDSPNQCFYNSVSHYWISQPLDHFDPVEERFFWQKYLYMFPHDNCAEVDAKCPICIFVGGDAAIHPWWLEHSFLAQKCVYDLQGSVFLLEHRFYGESAPRNRSTLDNLRYLTVSQALEDISSFILFIKRQYRLEKNKVFVFGASYGGTLAALFRRKYPHLAYASVALSAPMIREYQDKEYLLSIARKIRSVDMMCYRLIELGLRQTSRLMENHICSKQEYPLCHKIKDSFGLCTSLRGMTKVERRVFFGTFIKDFTFIAEYDGVLNVTLRNICDVITHPDIANWSPLDKVLAGDIVISQELFKSKTRAGIVGGDSECLQAKRQVICDYLIHNNDEHEVVTSGSRQRLWQRCTELGSFHTSSGDSKLHPFGGSDVLPSSFQQDFCVCAFGERFSQNYTMDRLRNYYKLFGSFSPSSPSAVAGGSRIIYTFGEDDPVLQRELRTVERFGSKIKTSNENIIFKVKGSAHCGEVFLNADCKETKMKAQHISVVQSEIVNQLLEWLGT